MGISKAGDGMEEDFSMRGNGDSLLLETLAAVLPSRERPGMGLGLLHRGRLGLIMPLGQLANDTPSNEPPGFTCGKKESRRGKNKRMREVEENKHVWCT